MDIENIKLPNYIEPKCLKFQIEATLGWDFVGLASCKLVFPMIYITGSEVAPLSTGDGILCKRGATPIEQMVRVNSS